MDEYGYSWLHIANEEPPPKPPFANTLIDERVRVTDGDNAEPNVRARSSEALAHSVNRPKSTNTNRKQDRRILGELRQRIADVRVLGPVEVSWREVPDRRVVTELACLLAMHPNRNITSERGARRALARGSRGDRRSREGLRNAVSLLRRALGPELVPEAYKGRGYRLAPEVTCDWMMFEELVDESHNASSREMEADLLTQALALVRGVPFQGVEPGTFSWAWTELIVARIEVAVVGAAHRLSVIGLEASDAEQASWGRVAGSRMRPL